MGPSRRTPPLFEAVGGPTAAHRAAGGPGGPASSGRTVVHPANANGSLPAAIPSVRSTSAPVVVESPRQAQPEEGRFGRSRVGPIVLMAAAAITLVGFVAWSVGYSRGQDAGKRSMLTHTTPEEAAIIAGKSEPTPPPPQVAPQPKNEQPSGQPVAGLPPITGEDPREPGVNYLSIVTMTWRDAEAAVRFLQKNGVPATCVPVEKVDPAKAQANNRNHLVFVLDGIPSSQYKASEARRAELVATIRKLGKRWQKEERGASDFGDPSWVLFKGK